MSGRLFIVATPIGNLGDVSLRALEVLRAVPLVAAEDTRMTRRLFARHGIATRLTSYHARNAAARTPALLEHLRSGADLALVTDAGTPGVSDPGPGLVSAWANEGGVTIPIPGPSAVLAAVAGSGIAGPRWSFEGFLPRSGRERRERIARLAADERATVVFEAPGRLAATLVDLAAACGTDRSGAVCRELTKLHESIVRATLGELARSAGDGTIPDRGEVTIVVGPTDAPRGPARAGGSSASGRGIAPAASGQPGGAADPAAAHERVERLVEGGMPRSEAARVVARETGLPRRVLYRPPGPAS
jgi:16S rRNA (cytidine1402-2'-O)-methyltransferase